MSENSGDLERYVVVNWLRSGSLSDYVGSAEYIGTIRMTSLARRGLSRSVYRMYRILESELSAARAVGATLNREATTSIEDYVAK